MDPNVKTFRERGDGCMRTTTMHLGNVQKLEYDSATFHILSTEIVCRKGSLRRRGIFAFEADLESCLTAMMLLIIMHIL
jgi:hypothetical protein